MRVSPVYIHGLLGAFICAWAFAADPVVSNVRVAQRPATGILDITYDLSDPDSDILSVSVNISTNDGASWFAPASSNLTGAVGLFSGAPGESQAIAWQGIRELPAEKHLGVKVRITACDSSPGTYLVIDLAGGTNAVRYPMSSLSTVPESGWTDEYKTTKLVLRRIPAGAFTMGSPPGEVGGQADETQHSVVLTRDFYIGLYELTQKQWQLINGNWPSTYTNLSCRETRPVESVSFNNIRGAVAGSRWPFADTVDSGSFLGRLRAKTNRTFDLPTEAQWEYACRAGTVTALNSGKNLVWASGYDGNVGYVARHDSYFVSYDQDTSCGTAAVGSYHPNQWGLYDMHGNVYEWCLDWYAAYGGSATDPAGPNSGTYRMTRGGGWRSWAECCRSAYRGMDHDRSVPRPYVDQCYWMLGLRPAMTCAQTGSPVTEGEASGCSPSGVYDVSPEYMAVGITVVPCGNVGSVHVVDDGNGGGSASLRLGGLGLLDDGQYAGIEGRIVGPGVLAFDWRVSSQEGEDVLRFYEVGTEETNAISGTANAWARMYRVVAGGLDTEHMFRWEYEKDPMGGFEGQDCGWIDNVIWSPFYTLTVEGGVGGGAYTNGVQVVVIADAAPLGKQFERWTGATQAVANVRSPTTTVTMPAHDIAVSSCYVDLFMLTVVNGTGSGLYTNGQAVGIAAEAVLPDKVFSRWTGDSQYLVSATSAVTIISMPPTNIAVTATYDETYALTVIGGTGSGTYRAGQRVAITAGAPKIGDMFDQWTGDVSAVSNVTSASTSLIMPATPITVTSAYRTLLPEGRFLHFNDYVLTNNAPVPTWVHVGPAPAGFSGMRTPLPGTNHYHCTGWQLSSCRTGSSAYFGSALFVPPKYPASTPPFPFIASNLSANLQNTLGAKIESPVFTNGVGTVYFEAINQYVESPCQITVEIATNMVDVNEGTLVPTVAPESTNGLEYVWQSLDVLELAAATTNDFTRYSRRLDCTRPVKLRIRRSGSVYEGYPYDSVFTVVDNIRVSLPPSDVVITQDECPFEPGYPTVGLSLKVRCTVSNLDMHAPSTSRAVKVCSRWRYLTQQVGAWQTNDMALVEGTGDGQGNGEVYEAALPPPAAEGDIEYFFLCAFDGVNYVSPDYTGTGLNGYPYAPELVSPRVLRGAGAEFSVRVRPHVSEYGAVCVESDQHAEPVSMALVADGVWQALVPMAGLTNLTWRFRASGVCEPGATAFSTGVTFWAASGALSARVAPHAGACAPDAGEGRLALRAESCGYVLITLDTRTLAYTVRRAEEQDFNVWPARFDVFSDSNAQVAKQTFLNRFSAWPTNETAMCRETVATELSETNVFKAGPFATPAGWVAGAAALVQERTVATYTINAPPVGNAVFRNQAVRLKGGDGALDLGYIRNAPATLTDGLKEVSFKCRAAQVFNAGDVAYYRNGLTNLNYLVKATARAVSGSTLSPENPSVSLVGYYRDPENFYEYRVTQVKDPADTASNFQDRRVRHGIYKWYNGIATRLAYSEQTLPSGSPLTSISDSSPIEMRLYNVSGTQTRIRCKYAASDNVVVALDSDSPHQSGTFGFVSSDCYAGCSYVRTRPTTADAGDSGVPDTVLLRSDTLGNFTADIANWYLPSGRYEARNTVTPKGIYSVTSSQPLGVYVQDADLASGAEPGPDWRLLQQITVSGYSYQAVTVPVNGWRPQFVKLQVMGGAYDVAVDEVAVTSWHGQEAGLGGADPNDWLATEAWVVSNSVDHMQVVQLDHSRGAPSAAQAIRSPVLAGMGALEFDYRVLRAPAALTVQFAREAAPDSWSDVRTFAAANATGWLRASAYLGLAENGYLRVVSARTAEATNALVEIDNALVWNEPAIGDASWKAYNAKITATDASRVALDQSKACFLNSSQTLEADPIQDLAEPHVQSPLLRSGLGLLAFSARAYTNGQGATVYVRASTNGWGAAEGQWFEVARFENITNTLYARITYEVPQGLDVDAVRLTTATTGGARRVCLEDIVVAEPLAVAADIVSVRAWPQGQTITRSGTPVDVTVRLAGRFALRKGVPEAVEADYPRLGLTVNGEAAWAPLHHLNATQTAGGWRTDAVFRYAVRPGDMASPLRLAGAGRPRDPYRFDWRGWEIYSQDTTSNAVWRFNQPLMQSADVYDPDLAQAGVTLRTLAFDEQAPGWVAATRTATWRVRTDRDVGGAPFQVQVWTPHTNLVQLGAVPGQASLRLDVTSGGAGAEFSEASFSVTGLAEGSADIYVQRVGDYEANATAGVANGIMRSLAIAPQPLTSWAEVAGALAGGGTYPVDACGTDAGGATVVCDGGGVGSVFRFIGDAAVTFTNLTIAVSNGATVVIEDLNIDNAGFEGVSAVCAADGHPQNRLELIGRSSAAGGPLAAGVRVASCEGATNVLTVYSGAGTNGALLVWGGDLSAGLGGNVFEAGGAVSVRGAAVVSALGGEYAAGVGGGLLAAGGAVEIAGEALVLATGGGSGACDVGPGAFGDGPARVGLTGGLLLSGSGAGGVSSFATGQHTSRAIGAFDPYGCWYAFSRDGAGVTGWLYVAGPTVGLHAISNASPAGAYVLAAAGGAGEVAFEIARRGPFVPSGIRREAAFYGPWLERHGLGEADLSALAPEAFDAAWLLDQNPLTFVRGELSLTGVEAGPEAMRATYALRAVTTQGAQAVARLNGRLLVLGAWSLGEPFVELADVTGTMEAGAQAFDIPHAANARFLRLLVLFPEE